MRAPEDLYRTDFRLWPQRQADAIRAGRYAELDREHLAEEVEDLWKWAAHALAMFLHACIELCYSSERHEAYIPDRRLGRLSSRAGGEPAGAGRRGGSGQPGR